MPNEVRRLAAGGVQHTQRILRHAGYRERTALRLAEAHAAVVEPDTAEALMQRLNLRQPAVAVEADALDPQHRRSLAADLVGETAPGVLDNPSDGRHCDA
jgi:hypothetical protein